MKWRQIPTMSTPQLSSILPPLSKGHEAGIYELKVWFEADEAEKYRKLVSARQRRDAEYIGIIWFFHLVFI